MKKLLILTSVRTGGGHVSLTEAITEQLDLRDDVEYRVVDGFDLMSPFQRWLLADSYGWITRRAWLIWFWRLAYRAVERNPWMSVRTFQRVCSKKFLALQREFQPDGILAVNPCFIGSVINIMEKAGTEAPMLSMQADLIDIPVAWFDKRTALNVALTDEACARASRPSGWRWADFRCAADFTRKSTRMCARRKTAIRGASCSWEARKEPDVLCALRANCSSARPAA